jgi:hypothetical protein
MDVVPEVRSTAISDCRLTVPLRRPVKTTSIPYVTAFYCLREEGSSCLWVIKNGLARSEKWKLGGSLESPRLRDRADQREDLEYLRRIDRRIGSKDTQLSGAYTNHAASDDDEDHLVGVYR